MRALTVLTAIALAVLCLVSVNSATYGYYSYSSLGWCLNGCRRLYWWRTGHCYCRMTCIRSHVLRRFDPDSPIACFYRRFCAHYQCTRSYRYLRRCRQQCCRKPPPPSPTVTTVAITEEDQSTATEYYLTDPGGYTESDITTDYSEAATSDGEVTEPTVEAIIINTEGTSDGAMTEEPTPEATSTEATTTEATTTEATTTEATTTEATTTGIPPA